MISKQLLLGLSLILGGGVILYAVNQGQNNTVKDVQAIKTAPQTIDTAANHDDGVARPTVEPLTVDMATEDKLLSVKQQVREARTLAQERQAMALIEAQEKAQQLALDKASAEQKALATATPADALTVEIRPEAIAVAKAQAEQERLEKLAKEKELKAKQEQQKRKKDEKAKADKLKTQKEQEEKKVQQEEKTKTEKQKKEPAKKAYDETPQKTNNGQHKVVRGDGLIKLSRQYGVPVSALAQANNMGRDDPLPLGKTIKIPSKTQVARLERDAKERKAQKIATERAEKRLKEARQRGSDGNVNARYGVQVSLANNQTKADELAKKYRDAGYTVSTSQTSRGVRVLVGSEKNQDAAAALRDKIKNDSRVDGSGAWVKRVQ